MSNDKVAATFHPEQKFAIALCLDCTPLGPMPFYDTEDGRRELTVWARAHQEGTGHNVMIPFTIYERKGR